MASVQEQNNAVANAEERMQQVVDALSEALRIAEENRSTLLFIMLRKERDEAIAMRDRINAITQACRIAAYA